MKKEPQIEEVITNETEFENLENNSFKGNIPKMIDSTITFKGTNNLLYCERDVVLENCIINFNCDNSIVYLKRNKYKYRICVSVHNNSLVYFGAHNRFKSTIQLIASEGKNIIVGNDGLFSDNISVRTTDAHLIYDAISHQRINNSKSIFIGDHVWIGQKALILKGTSIGSGSVIGAHSVLSGKKVPSNTSFAGNPAKMIKKNIYFDKATTHKYSNEQTKTSQHFDNADESFDKNKFIYQMEEENHYKFSRIDKMMIKLSNNNKKKLAFIKDEIATNWNKNRFFIPLPKEPKKNLIYYIRKFLRRILGI